MIIVIVATIIVITEINFAIIMAIITLNFIVIKVDVVTIIV